MRDPIPIYVHLRRAKDLIDRDFAEPLDVPALAREAHASRAHFVRSFKKAFGETPHAYLLRHRIERAKELLRNTQLTVTEVSLAVGFRSLGSFSTAFRQLVGESPSAYARRWRPAFHRRSRRASRSCTRARMRALFEKHAQATGASVDHRSGIEGGTQ